MRRSAGFALLLALLACGACIACNRVSEPDPPPKPTPSPSTFVSQAASGAPSAPAKAVPLESITGTPGTLEKVDIQVGTGAEAKTGQRVKVHYTGRLTNGTEFDSSLKREPYVFVLGAGDVIRGWDQGVVGMRVGGKRKLTIPYDLAYGIAGRPPAIPPKATLVFDIELLDIVP